ncbi:MAG: PDZ domain-containing protein [Candidatus Krumholzibacteriia bacterium]
MRRQILRFLLPVLLAVLTASSATAGDVYLGITMGDLSPSMARALQLDEDQGVLINEVVEGSPAEAAGLQPGDVILSMGDREIKGSSGLSRVIRSYDPGDEVELKVLREGKRKTLKVTLGEREKRGNVFSIGKGKGGTTWTWSSDSDDSSGSVFDFEDQDGDSRVVIRGLDFLSGKRGFLGVVPGDRDHDELRDLGAPDGRGVVVDDLVEGGAASAAGLAVGDIIVAIGDEPVTDSDDLHDALADTEPGQTLTVRVIRDKEPRDIEVTLGKSSGFDIGEALKKYMPGDPHNPQAPRFYEFHGGSLPPAPDLEQRARDEQDLAELKDELASLKDELKKLREELQKQR